MGPIELLKEEGRQEGLQKGLQEGRQEGRQEGQQKEKERLALKLLQAKMEVSFISKVTELPEKEIRKLKDRS